MGYKRPDTIFIDLDDTLIDTFGLLIAPLERDAAVEISRIEGISISPETLTGVLLRLRKKCPASLREKLRELSCSHADDVLAARDRIFDDFSVSPLTISPQVIAMLKNLAQQFRIVLVTEGRSRLQDAKLDHLGIRDLFDDIIIIDSGTESSKEASISKYMLLCDLKPERTLIVGNRLDREILAGNRLGVGTIWVRAGEGSEIDPQAIEAKADIEIWNLAELPEAINKLTVMK